jgi:Protein of unknown function (DUF3592)/Mu transposase, C-terminal
MFVIFGVWLALAGGVAALAGLAGAHRRRRLRGSGLTAWATIVRTPSEAGEPGERQGSVQFELEGGRIIERPCALSARRCDELAAGRKVLVWYDADDPDDVLVFNRDGRWSDRAFVAVGALLIVAGATLAAFPG